MSRCLSQIQPCLDAETPSDCPEKRAGLQGCKAKRLDIFHLQGKPVVLHVGSDVVKTMSCMIHADGLLMGCSTFGQIAGILNKGISFFSAQCGGQLTPEQYQLIPPMAIAERGDMWVPIAGSWRDPVLQANEIFLRALDQLIENKNMME